MYINYFLSHSKMSNLFGGLTGVRFPEVVMNQGPLPGIGRLPNPLHDVPDSRINYGSTLLGDITPYSYGGPAYLSSQNAYLHTPHRVQKVVPVLHLPEPDRKATFALSHGVDDSDLVFVMRLDKNSVFCKGTRSARSLGTVIDPLINLPTLNYILAGLQLGILMDPEGRHNLWKEFATNLDAIQFPSNRDFTAEPLKLEEVVHVVQHCVKPFGIMRGSEKQGGQDEVTLSASTWPVPFICTLAIDGKESNVVNIWHHHDVSAGDDLVLRLGMKPLRTYTLNHYYKRFERKTFPVPNPDVVVWQLVPDVLNHDFYGMEKYEELVDLLGRLPARDGRERYLKGFEFDNFLNEGRVSTRPRHVPAGIIEVAMDLPNFGPAVAITWHQLGYWHIGKSFVMMKKYGIEEFYNNDMANMLKTNHLELTFQPVFCSLPMVVTNSALLYTDRYKNLSRTGEQAVDNSWKPSLGLEELGAQTGSLMPEIDETSKPKSKRAKKVVTGGILKANGEVESAEMQII